MKLLRLQAVIEKTGHKKSKIYSDMEKGTFPLSIRTGEREVAWLESELDEWIAARVAERFTHEPIRGGTPRGAKRSAA